MDQSPNDGHQNGDRENKMAKVILLSRKLLTRENILLVLVAYAVFSLSQMESSLRDVRFSTEVTNSFLRDMKPRIEAIESALHQVQSGENSITSEFTNIQSELNDIKWSVENIERDVDSIQTMQLTRFR